jgi:hypothetical protein
VVTKAVVTKAVVTKLSPGSELSKLRAPFTLILAICLPWMSGDRTAPKERALSIMPGAQAPENSPQTGENGTSPVAPQAQSDKPSPSPSSEAPSKVQTKPSSTDTAAKSSKSKTSARKKASSKKASSKKPNAAKTKVSTDNQGSEKVVVKNGGTAEPAVQLSPRLSEEQASHQRENTDGLLATTDSNLKQMSAHSLSPGQQDTVAQIRSYMQQAKVASSAGDLERAYNLAFKARLLSDELLGH